ncbi:hypothetical protein PG988_006098 [Apiospora saccharicola]
MENDIAGVAGIFIISPRRLAKMGISFQRSTDLVRQFGMNPYRRSHKDGVHYATESHWMVHRWVPDECIGGWMSTNQFQKFCTEQGILEQNSGNPKRPPLNDVLKFISDNPVARKVKVPVGIEDAVSRDRQIDNQGRNAMEGLTENFTEVTLNDGQLDNVAT